MPIKWKMQTIGKTRSRQIDGAAVALCLLVLSWSYAAAQADENLAHRQTAYLSALTHPEHGNIAVFDNALLDKLFGKDRVTKPEDKKNQDESENVSPLRPRRDPQSIEPAVQPNQSLMVAITRTTSPKRATALRFAEKGRKLLRAGEHEKALIHLEKALALDPIPYLYVYLARAHYHSADYQQALNFLEVAEFWLLEQPNWIAEVAALRAESLRAWSHATSYAQAQYRASTDSRPVEEKQRPSRFLHEDSQQSTLLIMLSAKIFGKQNVSR